MLNQFSSEPSARVWQPHYPPYRPYLVRALSGDQPKPWDRFNIHLCGDTLIVDSLTQGTTAVRSPLVVFLQSPPTIASPSWYR